MVAVTNPNEYLDKRSEQRSPAQLFVKVLSNQHSPYIHALTIDASGSGVALLTHQPIAVGTRIKLYMGGDFAATGEITDLEWDQWGRYGVVRLGVHFIEKNCNWPL